MSARTPTPDIRVAAVITASNRASRGEYQDLSGDILRRGLLGLGFHVEAVRVVPDDIDQIQSAIRNALHSGARLVVTTGGTGVSPTDVTPEATLPLLERLLPGIPEALRAAARESVPTADLSRGVAGVIANALVVNLPGSPGAVRDALSVLERLASHVLDQLEGVDHIR